MSRTPFDENLDYCFAAAPHFADEVRAAARALADKTGVASHDALVVLGSGLKNALDDMGELVCELTFADIPGVMTPTAEGHGAAVYSRKVADKNVLVFTGRSHLYEGLTPTQICMGVRVAAAAGVTSALLTNAGGCLRDWELGDVMAIADHMNFASASPFVGGAFTDISHVWDASLTSEFAEKGIAQRTGVYTILRGPEYQTMAESRFLQMAGVDMVGMSTVLEAIALHQLGVRVAGLSVTSDLSFSDAPCEHEQVMAAVASAAPKVRAALELMLNS